VTDSTQLVVFFLDEQRYALQLNSVERVVLVVEITPLPKAPTIVRGIINVAGTLTPVLDIRSRFNLPGRDISLSDQLIIARTAKRQVALVVDAVGEVMELPAEEQIEAGAILPGLDYLAGVVKLADGLIFIHQLDSFLSLDEENTLDTALDAAHP
jgi:purine-binding chemotaxis protein CheW